jgi:hypothetical protein
MVLSTIFWWTYQFFIGSFYVVIGTCLSDRPKFSDVWHRSSKLLLNLFTVGYLEKFIGNVSITKLYLRPLILIEEVFSDAPENYQTSSRIDNVCFIVPHFIMVRKVDNRIPGYIQNMKGICHPKIEQLYEILDLARDQTIVYQILCIESHQLLELLRWNFKPVHSGYIWNNYRSVFVVSSTKVENPVILILQK